MAGQPVELQAGGLATDDAARADLYRLALLPEPGFRLIDMECLDPAGERLPAEIDLEIQSIAFAPGFGDSVACTFSLEPVGDEPGIGLSDGGPADDDPADDDPADDDPADDDPASDGPGPADDATVADVMPPRPGRWRAVNAASAMECGPVSTRLPQETDDGRIRVVQGGRRIIAIGIGENRARIVLDQVDGRPGLNRGQVRVRTQGLTMPLRYELEVVTDELIEGTMRADFQARGVRCQLERGFTLTFLGR